MTFCITNASLMKDNHHKWWLQITGVQSTFIRRQYATVNLSVVSPVQRIRNNAANCMQKTPRTTRVLIHCRTWYNVLAVRHRAVNGQWIAWSIGNIRLLRPLFLKRHIRLKQHDTKGYLTGNTALMSYLPSGLAKHQTVYSVCKKSAVVDFGGWTMENNMSIKINIHSGFTYVTYDKIKNDNELN